MNDTADSIIANCTNKIAPMLPFHLLWMMNFDDDEEYLIYTINLL